MPDSAGPHLQVISEQNLSMWNLGLTGNQLPAQHLVSA
jgi:hypothetical protein